VLVYFKERKQISNSSYKVIDTIEFNKIVLFNYIIEKTTKINGLNFKRKCYNNDWKKNICKNKNKKL